MTASAAQNIDIGTLILDNAILGKIGYQKTINNSLYVSGLLDLQGTFTVGNSIFASGDVTIASAAGATANVTLNGSSQTVTGGGTAPYFKSLNIVSTGTVNFAGTIGVGTDLIWTSGTVNAGTSKIYTQYGSGTINLGSQALYDLDLAHSGYSRTITGTLYVSHNLAISGGTTWGGTLDVKGDITATAGAVTSALIVSGSGAQSISSTAGFPTGTVTINKSAGVATLAANLSLSTSGQDLLLQSGSLDLNGKTLTVNDLFTLSSGTTMYTSCGSYSPSSGVKFSNSGTIVGGSNVYLSIDDVTVTEGSAATLTVSLSGVNCAAVNFNYATTDGTALAGSDYTSKSGSGSIAAGATSTTISVNTTADGVYEGGTENFSMGLSSVTGSSVSDNTGVVTITDADSAPTVQFSASTQTVLETAGTASITVSQSGASAFATTVPFTVSGTAVATTDFTLSPANSVTIAAGATSATVTATIVDNSVAAADKTVILTMGTVTNATASGRTTHTLTIQNDDLGAFTISGITGATDTTDDAYLSMDLLPKVSWSSSSGATSYNVTVYQDDGTTIQCATHNTASLSYQFTSGDCGGNLTVGTFYKAKVQSTDGTLTQLASNSLYRFKVNSAPTFSSQGPFYIMSTLGGSITINAAAASSPGVGADADGDTVTFSATANGALGTVVNGSTSFTYSPASASTFGTDTVAVTLSDGHGGTVSGNITIKLVSNVTWTGGGANSNWSTAANWCGAINASKTGCTNGGSAPSSTAVAIFDNTCVSNCSATLSADTTVGGIKLSSGTITQGTYNLTVNSNGGLIQTGGSFVGGSGAITQNGPVSLTGGSFKSTSATMTTIGQWTVTSGVTFDHNSGTIQFSSSYNGAVAMAVDNEVYNHITFAGNVTTYTLTGSMNIQGTTTLTTGASYSCTINNGTLLASGNVVVTQSGCAGSGTLKIVGSTNQSITDAGGTYLPSLQIASTGGTVSFSGTLNVMGNYTYTSGTVDVGTSTLMVSPGYSKTITVTPGNITYNNFTIYSYDSTVGFAGGTMKVGGTLSFTTYSTTGCTINSGTLIAYGDVMNSGGGCGAGTALVKIMGSGNQTVTGVSTAYFSSFEVASTGGVVTYSGTLQFYGNYTHTSGTVNSGTSAVNFFCPYSTNKTVIPGSTTFNDVTFSGSGANISLSSGTMNVAGTLTLTSQVGNGINLNSGSVLAAGNINVTGSGNGGSALIRLVGAANQTLTGVTGAILPDVEIASTGGTVSFSGIIDVRGNFTFTSGTLAAGTSTLRFMGTYASSKTVTPGSATYANIVFYSYDSTYSLGGGTLNASTLTFTTVSGSGCNINSGTLAVTGDVSVTVNGCAGTAGVNFTGNSDSSFTSSGGNFPRGNTTVTKGAANTLTLNSNLSLAGTGQTLTISSGTLNMNAKNLSVNSNLTISAGATLTQGGGTLTYGSLTNNGTLN